MTKQKYDLRNSMRQSKPPNLDEMIDLELDCAICGTRLYVSETLIDTVLASLKQAGSVMLVCYACNQPQLVRWKVPRHRDLHD